MFIPRNCNMTLLAIKSTLASFGFDSPVAVHCFDCFLVSSVLRWAPISSKVTKRGKTFFWSWLNMDKSILEMIRLLQTWRISKLPYTSFPNLLLLLLLFILAFRKFFSLCLVIPWSCLLPWGFPCNPVFNNLLSFIFTACSFHSRVLPRAYLTMYYIHSLLLLLSFVCCLSVSHWLCY